MGVDFMFSYVVMTLLKVCLSGPFSPCHQQQCIGFEVSDGKE
ncbi:hypothetical protein HanXRQr2_Chr03g0109481 [Helianthus annuus]|uniref:Uncharacterized protein n=1 Tax=Helianthus annuus TaxID=4232 RepID=A0A9K3JGV1_HELAN|nr:hypothetical protein HanXRQr2_Chr03g0109481 [Helianthus annuus]